MQQGTNSVDKTTAITVTPATANVQSESTSFASQPQVSSSTAAGTSESKPATPRGSVPPSAQSQQFTMVPSRVSLLVTATARKWVTYRGWPTTFPV